MIERAVYQILSTSLAIDDLVDNRVFVDLAEDVEGAYLVITLVSGVRPKTVDLENDQKHARIQIDGYAKDPEAVRELAEAVIAELESQKNVVVDGHAIQIFLLAGEPIVSYEKETELRRSLIEFLVYYN